MRLSTVYGKSNPANAAVGAKIGRNDPCRCGSGKKYKNCHMASNLLSDLLSTVFAIAPARCIITRVKLELATAQLSIVDGAWQESPDNLAMFDEAALFAGGSSRGNLYVVIEVAGELEGRDDLARQLVETVRREYAQGRGSIAGALTDAVRSANEFFYTTNANLPLEARRYAGITVAALREDELFIAQAGPGLVCVVRDNELQRYPDTSPWFMADDDAVNAWLATRDFPTPGAVPVGIRRDYTPDLFHATLQPGDIIVLSTRSLVHLLSNAELLDTLAHHHPDAIVTSLEDLAGAADLSMIAMRVAGENAPAPESKPQPPIFVPVLKDQDNFNTPPLPDWVPPLPDHVSPIATAEDVMAKPAPSEPTAEELARQRELEEQRAQAERHRQIELQAQARQREQEEAERKRLQAEHARARRAKIRSGFLRVGAGVTGGLAGIFGRINGAAIGNAADRAIDGTFRGIARLIVFIIRAIAPGEPEEETRPASSSPRSTAWQLASLVFPILLIAAGVFMWVSYRTDQQRLQADLVTKSIADSTQALARAQSLASSDKNAARNAAQNALTSAQQARTASPNDTRASKAFYDAEDFLDGLNGILVLFLQPSFLTFSDPQAKPSRIVTHFPDVFILDTGTQRIYRFAISDTGTSATPVTGDGTILKAGDKVGDRTVGQLIDMTWIDAGRLIVLDRNGAFWKYDPARSVWESKPGTDAATWARVNLMTSYAGNLYLIDAPNKQILKYVPNADWWTSPVTFFNPGVNPDLSNVVDISIDGDVWMLRSAGSILKCSSARCTDQPITDLDMPLKNPIALFTSQTLAGLYIADAGNERIVQMDKATGRFARQFKARGQDRASFTSLKAFAADDKRFYFVSGNQAFFANIPQ